MEPNPNGGRPRDMTRTQLVDALNRTLDQLELLAALLHRQAETLGVPVQQLQYPSGELALAPITTAAAQALAALAMLEAAP